VLSSVKPFLGVFWIYLLLTRRLKAAGAMAAAVLLCVLVGVLVFGWSEYLAWFRAMAAVDWAFAPMNGSMQGVLARTLAESPVFVPLVRAPAAVLPATIVLGAIVGAVALVTLMRDASERRVDRAFAGLLLTALLVSPLGWMYYVWFLAGPVLALWPTVFQRQSRVRDACIVAAVPGLLLPLYMTTVGSSSPWISLTLGSTYGWTLMALWCGVLIDGRLVMKTNNPLGEASGTIHKDLS